MKIIKCGANNHNRTRSSVFLHA